MKSLSVSIKVYIILLGVLAILTAIGSILPQGDFIPILSEQELPASLPIIVLVIAMMILVIYGGLGFLGIILSKKLGFPDIWDSKVTNKQRFLFPAIIGGGLGIFFIISDLIFSQFHSLGKLIHPPFPLSLLASISAGIGEELIFRLFFISFWVWLISYVILKKKRQNMVFWVVVLASALAFSIGHFPAMMLVYGFKTFGEIPLIFISEIILLNGVVSVVTAYYFRKHGFLAAVSIHLWLDVVWHVIYGLF